MGTYFLLDIKSDFKVEINTEKFTAYFILANLRV